MLCETLIIDLFPPCSTNRRGGEMVQLHVKRGDESQFLLSTSVDTPMDALIKHITHIYNGRLKVHRICSGEHHRDLALLLQTLKSRVLSVCLSGVCLHFVHWYFLLNPWYLLLILQRWQSWLITASRCRPTCKAWQRSRLRIWNWKMNGKISARPAEGRCLRRMSLDGETGTVRLGDTLVMFIFYVFRILK